MIWAATKENIELLGNMNKIRGGHNPDPIPSSPGFLEPEPDPLRPWYGPNNGKTQSTHSEEDSPGVSLPRKEAQETIEGLADVPEEEKAQEGGKVRWRQGGTWEGKVSKEGGD